MKVTLLMPALNEIEGMKIIVPRIKREWIDEVIVIDGGSVDGTIEYAKKAGYKVVHQKSKGITGAYREALPHITGDIIIGFSPDGNSIPELIPSLITKMRDGYDMVIVSRYLENAKSEDDDSVTAFGNWLFTKIVNILFGAHYTDVLVIFRAWTRRVYSSLNYKIPGRAGFETLSSVLCAKHGLKVAEIPGNEPKRIGGKRKMKPLLNGVAVLSLILTEFFTKKKEILLNEKN